VQQHPPVLPVVPRCRRMWPAVWAHRGDDGRVRAADELIELGRKREPRHAPQPNATVIVSGLHRLLLALLVLDCLQILVGLLALRRSRRSRLLGAPSHARYAREHAVLLLAGAAVLMVPIALGLADVVAESSAFYTALALEV